MVIACGTLPESFLKAYTVREHAESLLRDGEIRLGHLNSYKEMEDAAKEDPQEGEARFRVPGLVPRVDVNIESGDTRELQPVQGEFNYSGSWHNPFYAFCCSKLTVDRNHQVAKLGSQVVEIFDTHVFRQSLQAACDGLEVNGHTLSRIHFIEVDYDKGGTRDAEEARKVEAYIGAKPPRFEADQEIRVVLAFNGPNSGAPGSLMLRLPKPSTFCRQWTLANKAMQTDAASRLR
ncbi:MAG: hypothetical protein ABI618_06760 [Nitrospirota bacterium]